MTTTPTLSELADAVRAEFKRLGKRSPRVRLTDWLQITVFGASAQRAAERVVGTKLEWKHGYDGTRACWTAYVYQTEG